ncbi:MAG: glycosyltransferase family 4 protein [Pyrinomonadaceae bacterium]
MIKVTALTAFKNDPCSRFRFRQFIEPLAAHDIDVSEYYLPITRYRRQPLAALGMLLRVPGVVASRSSDITWFRRELIPERVTLERFTGGKRLFDVDDAIWLSSPTNFSEQIVEMCDAVIAGNSFLAEHYKPLGKPVWIVPTALDTNLWRPDPRAEDGKFVVGWLGTKYNLRYLYAIEEPLADFFNEHRDARLQIVSDGEPEFRSIPKSSVDYTKWTDEGEVAATQAMDIGLMPLDDTDWSRGKCAAKMLCYLSVGVPAIVTPVGVNNDILDLGEVGLGATDANDWFNALNQLYENRELAVVMGKHGRKLVEENYSVAENVKKLAEIFRSVANG